MCRDASRERVLERSGIVVDNELLTDTLALLYVKSSDIARCIQPGQFIHLAVPGLEAHILRRPFSVMKVDVQDGLLTILYQAVGTVSNFMRVLPKGGVVNLLGPIGKSWIETFDMLPNRALLVGGGVGAAPLYMLAEFLTQKGCSFDLVLGAKDKKGLVCLPHYTNLLTGEPLCTTDDGSYGIAGFTTQAVQELLEKNIYDYVACCGPEPMMKGISTLTFAKGIPTYVSLERRMACGIGACLSCVVDTTSGKRRACIDGPIFDASEVMW